MVGPLIATYSLIATAALTLAFEVMRVLSQNPYTYEVRKFLGISFVLYSTFVPDL